MLEQSTSEDSLGKVPMLEQLVKNSSSCKGLAVEFMEYCLLWKGPHIGGQHKKPPTQRRKEH